MVKSQKEGLVTELFSRVFLSAPSRKILAYYVGYCCLFIFFYFALVSAISFFHFLLDHELGVIEAWLNRNGWEILVVSKSLAAIIVLKSLKMNNYLFKDSWQLLRAGKFFPDQKAVAVCVFLPVFFLVLANQFTPGLAPNASAKFAATSYLGTIIFFMCDIFIVHSAVANFSVWRKRQILALATVLPALFIISTNAALPYLDQRSLFLPLHFLFLLGFVLLNNNHLSNNHLSNNHKNETRNNLANLLLYCALVAGPVATVFGADTVWGDSRSIFLYPETLPAFGVVALWLTGIVYYGKGKISFSSKSNFSESKDGGDARLT